MMSSISNFLYETQESTNTIVYCDMDGVLTDFNYAALSIDEDIFSYEPSKFWEKIKDAGSSFWFGMHWTEDGARLWDYLTNNYDEVYILTALPGLSNQDPVKKFAKEGKINWVLQNLGEEYLNKLICTTSKEKQKYANKNSILIDDREETIDSWNKAGGIGIHHTDTDVTIEQLKNNS